MTIGLIGAKGMTRVSGRQHAPARTVRHAERATSGAGRTLLRLPDAMVRRNVAFSRCAEPVDTRCGAEGPDAAHDVR